MNRRLRWKLAIALLVGVVAGSYAAAQDRFVLTDATEKSRLHFLHDDGANEEGFLVSMMGSGLATFDYDNDGWIDVLFLNGSSILPTSARNTSNALFRNQQNKSFSEVTQQSNIQTSQTFGLGVTAGDFNEDGFEDIVISNFGSVTLWKNQGDGTFDDVTESFGESKSAIAFGAGIAFLDVEKDGDLDIYVADYVDFNLAKFNKVKSLSYPYPPGPEKFDYRHDRLLLNDGAGAFIDASESSGIASLRSPSMGIVCGDFDGDNDTDVFVCSDARPNLLFMNDGNGKFTDEALIMGVARTGAGNILGSMGVDAADVDHDGLEDLFVTSYSGQSPVLFKNLGSLGFQDVTLQTKSGKDVVNHANWGVGLVDFNNDGNRDLMIGNGHLFKWVHDVEQQTDFKVQNVLLSNNRKGIFTNISNESGDGMKIVESTRGMAFDDLDNDGDIDCVALNSDAKASYLENESFNDHHWIQIELVGTGMNRDAVGAKVTVKTQGHTQTAEKRSGRSYQSHFGSRLHFGLGSADKVESIVVNWMGQSTEYRDVPVDRVHTFIQPRK
jgi:hypothetical protein